MNHSLRTVARSVRLAALTALRVTGGFEWFARSSWRRRRLLILCYHGVSLQDEHEWDPHLFVTPQFLRRRFELMKNSGCRVLPLDKAVRSLQDGTLPPRSVVLTFDDGFYNYYAGAVPLLEEYGYPATNYVSSYHSIHQRPILMLVLRYLLWRASPRVLEPEVLPGQAERIDLNDTRHQQRLYPRLLEQARALSHDRGAQQGWLADIASRLGVDWDRIVSGRLFHLMTAGEISSIAQRGFDIQLHTHRHRTPRDKPVFCSEVSENRNYLEHLTGRPATHFCYPSGDLDPVFLPWLRELGVETATTGIAGLAHSGTEPLLLPRYVDTMSQPETVFESWLSGASELLRRRGA